MRMQIQRWIREAWADQNPEAKLTERDAATAATLAIEAAKQVRNRRDRGMTWQEAWSEIALEVLGTPQPSVAGKAPATS